MSHQCKFCEKVFQRESTLAAHLCQQKRRYQEQKEPGVQIGLQAYLRFYELTQGSAKLKNIDDFIKSPYYQAFVKFGRQCVAIRAINVPRFVEWILKHNKKLDHWCRDSIYSEYLMDYLRCESVSDALIRGIETARNWSEESQHPEHDYLRFGPSNVICYAISTGRVSAWLLYNCDSGNEFLQGLNAEQISLIWPMIDADFWQKKFSAYKADVEYARQILGQAGW